MGRLMGDIEVYCWVELDVLLNGLRGTEPSNERDQVLTAVGEVVFVRIYDLEECPSS
jgi:hypothetical protein